MVLGQSAATAAAMAIDANVPIQQVPYAKLKERLLADKQMLVWTGPRRAPAAAGIDPAKLPGVVVDDAAADLVGGWTRGNVTPSYVGGGYRHDGNANKGTLSATFHLPVKAAGRYEVRLSYPPNPNRATNVPVTVAGFAGGGRRAVAVDQQKAPPIDKLFVSLGTFAFDAGATATVEVSNAGTNGHVIVDAVQLVPAKE